MKYIGCVLLSWTFCERDQIILIYSVLLAPPLSNDRGNGI